MKRLIASPGTLCLLFIAALTFTACSSSKEVGKQNPEGLRIDSRLIGQFEDDYGIRYSISEQIWQQHPGSIYHIEYWDSDDQYVIAQNDEITSANPGKWTRIDWTPLENMAPYEWGFCLTVYDAPTATAAAAVIPALSDTPLTGCNGFPFSRMKRIESEDDNS
jgi:hypothetical protein